MVEFVKFRYRLYKVLYLTLAVFLFAFFSSLVSPRVYAFADVETFKGRAYVVMESDSLRVLSAMNEERIKEPASTTKILTAICVLENADIEKSIEIPKAAVGVEGSSIYLKEGEKWRIKDLIYGLMTRSGNDAAVALAIATSGSVEKFVDLMNATAFKAGAFSSRFDNPHGLHSPNHYVTAKDLALITAYAMKNPTFRDIASSKSYTFRFGDETRTFVNKNKMLSLYDGAIGVKTGYTKASGRCLVSAAERNGLRLICVVLNESDMWGKSMSLLDAAYAEYENCMVLNGEPFVLNSLSFVTKPRYYPLKREEKAALRVEYTVTRSSRAFQEAGYANVWIGDRLIFCEKVYTI
ncbi:MAG: D-alanyl-D-alanine carboxypeptidase [Clostridia bacterium]|nr:D-alanyl-D-alanine carboxypeptidase [Clostridia bacterium]